MPLPLLVKVPEPLVMTRPVAARRYPARRGTVRSDGRRVKEIIAGARVMVTGAGGYWFLMTEKREEVA